VSVRPGSAPGRTKIAPPRNTTAAWRIKVDVRLPTH